MVALATLLAGRLGEPLKVEGVHDDGDPDQVLYASGAVLPGPGATLTGPTYEEWLDSQA
jgi:hypothetical protein